MSPGGLQRGSDNVFFLPRDAIVVKLRASPMASRGWSVPEFLRKPIATCDCLPGRWVGSGSAHGRSCSRKDGTTHAQQALNIQMNI